MDRSLYQPSPWSEKFHDTTCDQVLGGGAAGPGKSLTLLWDPIVTQAVVEHARMTGQLLDQFPPWLADLCRKHPIRQGESEGHALHMRRTMPQLQETIDRSGRMFKKFDEHANYSKELHRWEFSSGYKYTFGHCRESNSHEDYLSKQYCVAMGTLVLMGDDSFRRIEDIQVGDLVATLEGPRRVLATWDSGLKPCVEAVVRVQDEIVGRQLHPTTHPVLQWTTSQSACSSSSDRSQSDPPAVRCVGVWQDFESLLDGLPESPASRASRVDEGSGFAASDGTRLELQRLPALTVPVVLSERALRLTAPQPHSPTRRDVLSEEPSPSTQSSRSPARLLPTSLWGPPPVDGSAQRDLVGSVSRNACDGACARDATGTATDSAERCSPHQRLRGGRLQSLAGSAPESPPRPGGAEERRSSDGSQRDARETVPECTLPSSAIAYANFHTRELRPLTEGVRRGTAELKFAGWASTWDLTVEGANHYITEGGMVSSQTHLALDEAYQFEEKQFEELDGRVRSADPILRLLKRTRLMSNPAPGWLKDTFVVPERKGNTVLKRKVLDPVTGEWEWKTSLFLPATLDDNPDKAFVRDYKFKLLSKPAHMRARYLYGDWDSVEGGYFEDDYNPGVHRIAAFKIPRDWPKFRVMDWGYKTHGTCVWIALDPDENMYIFYEFNFRLMKDEECAKRMVEIEKRFGFWDKREDRSRLLSSVADTQLWEERGDSGKSKAAVFAEHGLYWEPADKASIQRNAERVSERLRDYDDRRPPALMIFEECKKTCEMLSSIKVDDSDSLIPDKKSPLKHWFDVAAYGAARASRGAGSIVMELHEFDRPDNDDFEQSLPKASGFGYGS